MAVTLYDRSLCIAGITVWLDQRTSDGRYVTKVCNVSERHNAKALSRFFDMVLSRYASASSARYFLDRIKYGHF